MKPNPAEVSTLNHAEIEALAHRAALFYKKSTDPNHSDTYTFNRTTLIDFARKLLSKKAENFDTSAQQVDAVDTFAMREKHLEATLLWYADRVAACWAPDTASDSRKRELYEDRGKRARMAVIGVTLAISPKVAS